MTLKTTHSMKDGVVVVRHSGAIYFGEESTALRVQVKYLLEKSRHIVLDLDVV